MKTDEMDKWSIANDDGDVYTNGGSGMFGREKTTAEPSTQKVQEVEKRGSAGRFGV